MAGRAGGGSFLQESCFPSAFDFLSGMFETVMAVNLSIEDVLYSGIQTPLATRINLERDVFALSVLSRSRNLSDAIKHCFTCLICLLNRN